MIWIIGFLTVILILDCLFLMLLVLVQLPKKEAGLGQAFGGGATDALFGAGSGNALTKLTKYATGIFFVLTLSLSILHAHQSRGGRGTAERLERQRQGAGAEAPAAALPPGTTAASQPTTTPPATSAPASTSSGLLSAQTNTPATAPGTNAAGQK